MPTDPYSIPRELVERFGEELTGCTCFVCTSQLLAKAADILHVLPYAHLATASGKELDRLGKMLRISRRSMGYPTLPDNEFRQFVLHQFMYICEQFAKGN